MKKIIYIEAANKNVPETNFLVSYIEHIGINDVLIVPINGKGNLANSCQKIKDDLAEGNKPVILFDADGKWNKGGFNITIGIIKDTIQKNGIKEDIDVFLWPNNKDDGDFEIMLEHIVQREKHKLFFDCFNDYEICVSQKYDTPNRKGKFHTFMNAHRELSGETKKKFGKGEWLFFDKNYWDWDAPYLNPLRDFLKSL